MHDCIEVGSIRCWYAGQGSETCKISEAFSANSEWIIQTSLFWLGPLHHKFCDVLEAIVASFVNAPCGTWNEEIKGEREWNRREREIFINMLSLTDFVYFRFPLMNIYESMEGASRAIYWTL